MLLSSGAEAKMRSLNPRELLFEVIGCHWSALLEEEKERVGRKGGLNLSSSHTEVCRTQTFSPFFFLEISIHGNEVARLELSVIALRRSQYEEHAESLYDWRHGPRKEWVGYEVVDTTTVNGSRNMRTALLGQTPPPSSSSWQLTCLAPSQILRLDTHAPHHFAPFWISFLTK